jgi:hypothetical protein
MTSTTDRQAQPMTTTNQANLSRSAQGARGSMMKRARTFTMSLAFAAAVLTFLLTGAVTAQAQNNCSRTYGYYAVCWANNDSGYIYQQINGRWHYTQYFEGASTNVIYSYVYATRQWTRNNKSEFNGLIKLVVLTDQLMAHNANLPKPHSTKKSQDDKRIRDMVTEMQVRQGMTQSEAYKNHGPNGLKTGKPWILQ